MLFRSHTSTYALTNATLPYLLDVATNGPGVARNGTPVAHGLNTFGGHVTYKAVADALGVPHVTPEDVLRS